MTLPSQTTLSSILKETKLNLNEEIIRVGREELITGWTESN